MTAADMQQYLSHFGIADAVSARGDGSVAFTSGPYAGYAVSTGALGPTLILDHQTGVTLGKNATGKTFAINEPIWKTALKGEAPWVTAGLGSVALGGGAAAGAGKLADAGSDPTTSMTLPVTNASGDVLSPGSSPVPMPGTSSGLDWGKILKGVTPIVGTAIGATTGSPTQAQNAPLQAALAQLLPLLQSRVQAQQPLIDSVNSMAQGMLPKAYQKGSV